jgi:hypothetical protein
MDVDLGVFLETKLMGGIYTWNLIGYSVITSNAPSAHQGWISFFWWQTKHTRSRTGACRPNVLSFVIVIGSQCFYVMGCYIPPNDLPTLVPQVKQALIECPKGHTPLLLGNLNIKLCTPWVERDERIAEVLEDVCGLTNLSKHFCQQSCGHTGGRCMWRMRRGRRWVTSQCDYFLGRVTDRKKFCKICLRHPFNQVSDH